MGDEDPFLESMKRNLLLFVFKRRKWPLLMMFFVGFSDPILFFPPVSRGVWRLINHMGIFCCGCVASFSLEHVLIIHGCFTDSNDEFYLFNIYAPCDNEAKQLLWNSLSEQLQKLVEKKHMFMR